MISGISEIFFVLYFRLFSMSGLAQVIYVLLQHLAKHLKKKMKVKVLPAFFMMSHKRLE